MEIVGVIYSFSAASYHKPGVADRRYKAGDRSFNLALNIKKNWSL